VTGQRRTDWHPDDWEEHCNALLRLHYGWDYQAVPDKDRGDLGMEGFSRDGCAYQCYSAEPGLTTTQLYQRQRDKMTVDLGKLAVNDGPICDLLGDVRIRRWIFLVPVFDSRELVRHAASKSKELRAQAPDCLHSDFAVVVATDDHFATEREQIFKSAPYRLGIPVPDLTVDDIKTWESAQSELLENLKKKVAKIPAPVASSEDGPAELRKQVVLRYLEGQGIEAHLNATFPDLWLRLTVLKSSRVRTLAADTLVSTAAPRELVTGLLDSLEAELRSTFPHLVAQHRALAWGIVAAWLVECALDFPEPVNV
jgi:hypothetical protein